MDKDKEKVKKEVAEAGLVEEDKEKGEKEVAEAGLVEEDMDKGEKEVAKEVVFGLVEEGENEDEKEEEEEGEDKEEEGKEEGEDKEGKEDEEEGNEEGKQVADEGEDAEDKEEKDEGDDEEEGEGKDEEKDEELIEFVGEIRARGKEGPGEEEEEVQYKASPPLTLNGEVLTVMDSIGSMYGRVTFRDKIGDNLEEFKSIVRALTFSNDLIKEVGLGVFLELEPNNWKAGCGNLLHFFLLRQIESTKKNEM